MKNIRFYELWAKTLVNVVRLAFESTWVLWICLYISVAESASLLSFLFRLLTSALYSLLSEHDSCSVRVLGLIVIPDRVGNRWPIIPCCFERVELSQHKGRGKKRRELRYGVTGMRILCEYWRQCRGIDQCQVGPTRNRPNRLATTNPSNEYMQTETRRKSDTTIIENE